MIIDPHLSASSSYPIFEEAREKGILVQNPEGDKEFVGTCWPGKSSWVDFTHPESGEWWGGLYGFDKYKVIEGVKRVHGNGRADAIRRTG